MRKIQLYGALFVVCGLGLTCSGYAQNKKTMSINFGGYVSEMPSAMWLDRPQSTFYWQNLAHNRLNFSCNFAEYFTVEAGLRTRFIFGSNMLVNPDEMSFDKGWTDLTWNIFYGNRNSFSTLLNTSFDRLNFIFEKDRWQIKLGRQRINWGQNFVWNPNDIFNTYSFFDFDYPERPGCDALRTTFFHSATASTEFAMAVNHYGKLTAAVMHHFNWRNVDFQIIAGEQTEDDMVLGGAITGDVKGVTIRSEFSAFQPVSNFTDTVTTVAVSLGLDYVFANSLMLQTEALYNNASQTTGAGNIMSLVAGQLSAKKLSICDWNLFAQASYPFTPRFNGAVSMMYFIDAKAFYSGLSLDFSLLDDLDLSLMAQYFHSTEPKMNLMLGFARLKYSF
ncbi:MAG: hypothetical protein LBV41_04830 [Cytophagaceae bacterium]|nr:hypothetical protein [Cytophagaceae bacterium]